VLSTLRYEEPERAFVVVDSKLLGHKKALKIAWVYSRNWKHIARRTLTPTDAKNIFHDAATQKYVNEMIDSAIMYDSVIDRAPD
jgi:hypothetical protein